MLYLIRFIKALLISLVFVLAMVVVLQLPSHYTPWDPLDLNAPLGPFTKMKLQAFDNHPQDCYYALRTADIEFRQVDDRSSGTCTLTNNVVLDKTHYPYSRTVRGACPLAAAIVMWEDKVVTPAAETHLNSDITRINHLGIFSCRTIAGSSRKSQHAYANAIDISGFALDNGETISLLRDWGDDTDKGRFLKEIQSGSCKIFNSVLGPDYNAAHDNHFHLDLGPYRICR